MNPSLRRMLFAALFLLLPLTACEKSDTARPKASVLRGQVKLSLEHQRTLKETAALYLIARISQSGAAMPRTPGDIEGFPAQPFVPVGTENVEIELTQIRR